MAVYVRQGDVTFGGAETKSAHINGTDGDIPVYTFLWERACSRWSSMKTLYS